MKQSIFGLGKGGAGEHCDARSKMISSNMKIECHSSIIELIQECQSSKLLKPHLCPYACVSLSFVLKIYTQKTGGETMFDTSTSFVYFVYILSLDMIQMYKIFSYKYVSYMDICMFSKQNLFSYFTSFTFQVWTFFSFSSKCLFKNIQRENSAMCTSL